MSSSPKPPAPATKGAPAGADLASLMSLLDSVPDPRAPRGVRHPMASILAVSLAVSLAAVLAGARSFVAIGEWAVHQPSEALLSLGVTTTAPGESTIRRVFTRLQADVLDRFLGAYLWTRTTTIDGPSEVRRVIAIDGKTVRGARSRHTAAPHLIAAFDHAGAVLEQVTVAAKSNEIPAVRDLLGCLDLHGCVITVDAMHTQADTAQLILDAGGDYVFTVVFTVKGNQPTLHAACKKLPWAKTPAHRVTTRGHGRRSTRTMKVIQAPWWIRFTGAAQVAQVRRTVTRRGKKTVEVVYLITSANHRTAPPRLLAAWVQDHWGIENQLHWVRDVSFDEDRSQVRTGNAPHVMATLRNTAISLLRLDGWTNIAAGLRHHARNPRHPVTLLQRRRRLKIPTSWPWAAAVVAVFANIAAIPQPA